MFGRQTRAKCLRKQPEFSRLDKSRSFFLVGITFLVLLLIAGSIFYISTHVQVVSIGYEINQALVKKQRLIEENKKLALEIARLRSPTRIEKEAREKLNLVIPGPHQWIPLAQLPNYTAPFTKTSPPASKPRLEKKSKPSLAKKTPQSAPPKEKETKNVLVAKIVRPFPKAIKVVSKKPKPKKISKSKESVPAVLVDPLP